MSTLTAISILLSVLLILLPSSSTTLTFTFAQPINPLDQCANHTTCDECALDASFNGCGMCLTSLTSPQVGQCEAGTTSGPVPPASCQVDLGGSLWRWSTCRSASDPCSLRKSCRACTVTQSCGWCVSTLTCIDGTTRPFNIQQCPAAASGKFISKTGVNSTCPDDGLDDDMFWQLGGITTLHTLAIGATDSSPYSAFTLVMLIWLALTTVAFCVAIIALPSSLPIVGSKNVEEANATIIPWWKLNPAYYIDERTHRVMLVVECILFVLLLSAVSFDSYTTVSTHNQHASFGLVSATVSGGGLASTDTGLVVERRIPYACKQNLETISDERSCATATVTGGMILLLLITSLVCSSLILFLLVCTLFRLGPKQVNAMWHPRLYTFAALRSALNFLSLILWLLCVHTMITHQYGTIISNTYLSLNTSWILLSLNMCVSLAVSYFWKGCIEYSKGLYLKTELLENETNESNGAGGGADSAADDHDDHNNNDNMHDSSSQSSFRRPYRASDDMADIEMMDREEQKRQERDVDEPDDDNHDQDKDNPRQQHQDPEVMEEI